MHPKYKHFSLRRERQLSRMAPLLSIKFSQKIKKKSLLKIISVCGYIHKPSYNPHLLLLGIHSSSLEN